MWDLSSTTKRWTCVPCTAQQSLNQRTTREEVPGTKRLCRQKQVEKAKVSSEETVDHPPDLCTWANLHAAPGWAVWEVLEKRRVKVLLRYGVHLPHSNTALMICVLFKERTSKPWRWGLRTMLVLLRPRSVPCGRRTRDLTQGKQSVQLFREEREKGIFLPLFCKILQTRKLWASGAIHPALQDSWSPRLFLDLLS